MSEAQLQLDTDPAAGADPSGGLTAEQARAVAARDRDVLLEAGAGTGKTRVLVERYCDAAVQDAGVDGILAFTFTERAAAELRHRIRAELAARAERAAARGDAERAELLATISRDSERALISTIHGFCRRLLASHPVALGLDPRFRVLDEPEADRVAARAFDEALEELIGGNDPEAARLVASIGIAPLRELVRSAHDELRTMGRSPELPDAPATDPAAAIAQLAEAARGALDEATEAGGGGDAVERMAEAAALDAAPTPDEAVVEALELRSKARAVSGPACDLYREAWAVARRALSEHANADLYRRLAELLRTFAARFAALKEGRSGLDFEDLQLEAARLLREHPGIAEGYHERFRHVMVDEFQDTNELQLSLVRLLAGPETRLFAVGDEFQSIYGFRHADLRVFRGERERIRGLPPEQAELLALRGNFRSAHEVVAAANLLGHALLDDFRPLGAAADRHPPPGLGGQPAVELLLTPGGREWKQEEIGISVPGDYPSPPDRIAEARFLATRLRALHESHAVPRGDMVVLLRAFTHVAAFEEELERAGLAPYVVGGRGYWSQQQVDDLRRLLGTLANPLDDHCLLGALSSPACAVLPDTLWLLRQAAGKNRHLWPTLERRFGPGDREPPQDDETEAWMEAIPERDAERLSRFCETLAELRGDAPRLGLEELIDRSMSRFGYDLAALMLRGGKRRFANARKLMRMARRYEAAEGRDLRGFLDSVEEQAGRLGGEGEAATAAEQHDGVRVMTVHAAKGLEFPVVAVADLGRGLLAGGRPPAIRIDRDARIGLRLARFGAKAAKLYAYDELTQQAEREEVAEACRLAYVAATRAQDRLILSGCYEAGRLADSISDDELPLSTSASVRLLRALGIEEPQDGLVEGIAVRVNRPEPDAFGALSGVAERRGESGLPAAGRPPLLSVGAAPEPASGHLSYSALAGYGRCGYRFYAERIVGMPGLDEGMPGLDGHSADGEPTGATRRYGFGNAVHAMLEWSARGGWREPPVELCRELLLREGLLATPEDRERAREMVGTWLASEACAELRETGARGRAEMPFLLPVGDSIVRGKMDLLAETPSGVLVVDFKTDSLADAAPEALVDRYAVQGKIYALAASRGLAPVRTAFAFLDRGGAMIASELGPDELVAARSELEGLIAGVSEGRFEVTDSPHWALCHDCPARQRLCSHPKELTGRRLE